MWPWKKKEEEESQPAAAPNPTPTTTPSRFSPILQSYLYWQQQQQQQQYSKNMALRQNYGGSTTYSGGGPYQWTTTGTSYQAMSGNFSFQSTLPVANLAIIAMQTSMGVRKGEKVPDGTAFHLEQATKLLEKFFQTGEPSLWTGFLAIIEAAKTGDQTVLKGTTVAALLEEKHGDK